MLYPRLDTVRHLHRLKKTSPNLLSMWCDMILKADLVMFNFLFRWRNWYQTWNHWKYQLLSLRFILPDNKCVIFQCKEGPFHMRGIFLVDYIFIDVFWFECDCNHLYWTTIINEMVPRLHTSSLLLFIINGIVQNTEYC